MNKFYCKMIAAFSLAAFVCAVNANAGGGALEQLEKEAIAYFEKFHTAQSCYDEATKLKNGKGKFPQYSYSSIVYAGHGYARALGLSQASDGELSLKALHNLAMTHLSRGEITSGRAMLQAAAAQKFAPSQKNLKMLDEALFQFKFNPITAPENLPVEAREMNPYGLVDRDFAESIMEALWTNGVARIEFTSEELKLFELSESDLKDLETLAMDVEKHLAGVEDACVILLGRSPLLIGRMLAARGMTKLPMVALPYSGMKSIDMKDSSWGPLRDAYVSFMQRVLPKVTHYYILDGYDSGSTLRAFGEVSIKGLPKESKLHALLFDVGDNPKRAQRLHPDLPEFSDWHFLTDATQCVGVAAAKSLFARMYLTAGLSFFPRQWINDSYRDRAMAYARTQNDGPVVQHLQAQMNEFSRLRGTITRELLADPLIGGEDAITIGQLMAGDVVFGNSL